jgi:ribulose 1,5-bisphosphate synthetase/thiazole synthase
MVAKSAPWMNGKARKKARKESVGKPGIFVAGLRPADVTASSAVGKTNGKMMFAGWRAVRTTDRRAT